MLLFTSSLNSGSNGNCYYVGDHASAVLVDVGISCREVEKRMARLKLPMSRVKAIFISHEHTDHIKGVEVLSKKYRLPVYITPSTLRSSRLELEEELIRPFLAGKPVVIGELSVTGFKKFHDASEPHSFIVERMGVKVGVFTDIGMPCDQVVHYFKQCHAAFLEANYDEQMLEEGHYPYYLKKRISGDKGHLSNTQALSLFTKYKPDFMSHLFLSHLSKENNSPHMVQELFAQRAGRTSVIVASRYMETEVFGISNDFVITKPKVVASKHSQLSLF
ncbi:MAG: MBL fold metallo-hydrolase [Bacteroidia bacterium]